MTALCGLVVEMDILMCSCLDYCIGTNGGKYAQKEHMHAYVKTNLLLP